MLLIKAKRVLWLKKDNSRTNLKKLSVEIDFFNLYRNEWMLNVRILSEVDGRIMAGFLVYP